MTFNGYFYHAALLAMGRSVAHRILEFDSGIAGE